MLEWNAARSSPGSLLAGREQSPLVFRCGLRVVSGAVPGEGTRWHFRPSAVDPYRPDDSIRMRHGNVALRLWIDFAPPVAARRYRHALIAATIVETGARIELSVPIGELRGFGVDV